METTPSIEPTRKTWSNLAMVAYVACALLLFLVALELMVTSLQHLSKDVTETILLATVNPFIGFFIGLLITAILQSSSTTTALVVAFVSSGALTLQSSIPIIMGANVGTTITAMIVSFGFFNRRKEFRRALSAGSFHVFFNLLTVFILFPLEYYYDLISSSSSLIAQYIITPSPKLVLPVAQTRDISDSIVNYLIEIVPSPFIISAFALVLLFASIILFRRLISTLLKAKSPEAFARFFFQNQWKSFGWGLLTTAAIRSSTITTSVVVPVVAKRIASLKQAAPFIMGANVGTTITAFIAATMQGNTISGVSIALAHFLFNFIGVILFMPLPVLAQIPLRLSDGLGKISLKYRLSGFVFLLLVFFFIPFTLIYFNRGAVKTISLTYEHVDLSTRNEYRVIARLNRKTSQGELSRYEGATAVSGEVPSSISPVYVKNQSLFIGDDVFLLQPKGYCWDGQDTPGKYHACIDDIVQRFTIAGKEFDSVYVCRLRYADTDTEQVYYISAQLKIILQRDVLVKGTVQSTEKLTKFEQE